MSSDNPFFSVIMPTYNRADFIGVAIDSVLAQEFSDFELIIIDDGSTDNTDEVIKQYDDDRIRYFNKPNEERNIARNYGVNHSKGRFICFLDSDDYYYPHHLQSAFNYLTEEEQIRWLVFGAERRDVAGRLIECTIPPENNHEKELLKHNYLTINGSVISRELFKNISFLPSKNAVLGEDHCLWLRFIVRYPLKAVAEITSVTVEHEKRSLKNFNIEKLETGTYELINALKKDAAFVKSYKNKARWFYAFSITLLSTIANEQGELNKSKKYLKEAFKMWPLIIFSKRYLAAVKNVVLLSVTMK